MTFSKSVSAILIAVIAVALAAIALGSYYTWPSLETINESRAIHTGILTAWEHAMFWTDGRYTTNFLHTINPVALGWMMGYKLVPLAGFLLFAFCSWFFISTFAAPGAPRLLFALLFTVVHFALSPSISYELFTIISSFVYLYSACLWMLWVACAVRFLHRNAAFGTGQGYFAAAAFLLLASTGLNEMMLIVNAITLAMLMGITFLAGQRYSLLPLLPVFGASAYLLLAAGGSGQRMAYEAAQHGSNFYLAEAGFYVNHYAQSFGSLLLGSGGIFIAFTLLVFALPLKPAIAAFFAASKKASWWVVLCMIALVLLMPLPFYVLKGSMGKFPERVFALIMSMAQLCLLLLLMYAAARLPGWQQRAQKLLLPHAVFLLAMLLLGRNNYTGIAGEYRSGIYQKFNAENLANHRILTRAAQQKDCSYAMVTPPCSKELFIFCPVSNFPNDLRWPNRVLEFYYLLNQVQLTTDSLSEQELLQQKYLLHEN